MMNNEDFGVVILPRPAPISSFSDLLIPSFAVLGAFVLSINPPIVGVIGDTKDPANASIIKITTFLFMFSSLSLPIEDRQFKISLIHLAFKGGGVGNHFLFPLINGDDI